jgi:hypothetical protein
VNPKDTVDLHCVALTTAEMRAVFVVFDELIARVQKAGGTDGEIAAAIAVREHFHVEEGQ